MDESQIRDRAHSLLEELFAFGVDLSTVERAICGAVMTEREACAKKCDAVVVKSRNSLFRSGAAICAGEIRGKKRGSRRTLLPGGRVCYRMISTSWSRSSVRAASSSDSKETQPLSLLR